jgi:hypothetical protein
MLRSARPIFSKTSAVPIVVGREYDRVSGASMVTRSPESTEPQTRSHSLFYFQKEQSRYLGISYYFKQSLIPWKV